MFDLYVHVLPNVDISNPVNRSVDTEMHPTASSDSKVQEPIFPQPDPEKTRVCFFEKALVSSCVWSKGRKRNDREK